ncbi:carbamoyl transferase [Paenibacillus sp. ACRRX]|uniref:carbamoyl transferase n=1 Tax=Paenibacillus sp. ACRRX TaxID=2918206 RepID=UPI001EF5D75C|nr:carbamoyl transferase [Paenibacillus sp. ACRRX]
MAGSDNKRIGVVMDMKLHMRAGWDWLKDHLYIWIILFLYQLLWGFLLFRFMDSVIMPILRRYPSPAPTEMSSQLFLLESQFQLTKTSTYTPYLWIIVAFIAVRMLLTPIIHAGICYSMANHRTESGLTFFRGIAAVWKPFALLYLLETALMLAPAYWAIPYLAEVLASNPSWQMLLTGALPVSLAWLVGGWLLHHLFLFLQFGAGSDMSLLHALKNGIVHVLPVIGLSLLFVLISLVCSTLVTTAAMLWTGMTALILQQAYPALRAFLKLWSLSSRYHAWNHRKP